jgi:signal transduction histidine kinase
VCLDLEQAFAGIQDEVGPEGSSGRGIRFRVIAEGKRRALHPLLRDEVYRIGREALLNAFRHARAHRIDVTVTYSADRLRVQVRDDGCGIDPDILRSGREGHWGLSGMRERADRIGGKFRVMSSASAGTEVELLIPGKIAYRRNQADDAKASDVLSGASESAEDLLRRAL